MLSGIKVYHNQLGWKYHNVEGVVLVFSQGKLIKTISTSELNELIKLKVVY